MSLREEMARYEHLTGESAEHIPIIKLGAYLDGVDRGIAELEKLKEEFEEIQCLRDNLYNSETEYSVSMKELRELFDNHIKELKGETDE